jgi:hypothetical protein
VFDKSTEQLLPITDPQVLDYHLNEYFLQVVALPYCVGLHSSMQGHFLGPCPSFRFIMGLVDISGAPSNQVGLDCFTQAF